MLAAGNFELDERQLISILQEAEKSRIFLEHHCTSLHGYVMKVLKLSEDVASNLIAVARKSRTVPELKLAVEQGTLSVSTARKIVPILTKENQSEWIEKAQSLTTRALESEIVRFFPREAVRERVKPVAEDRLEFRIGISKKLHEKMIRIQDLESQRLRRAVSLEKTLDAMADVYLEKKDPVIKAERVLKKLSIVRRTNQPINSNIPNRVPISAVIQHEVRLRDQGQCVHQDLKGIRCINKRWVELHHIRHRAEGGLNTTENLVTLCSAHHRGQHLKLANVGSRPTLNLNAF